MRKIIILLVILTLSVCLTAEGWKKTADFNLLLSQSYYSDNWEGSELGNISWTASFKIIMEKQLNKMLYDKNSLEIAFGQTHYQQRDENNEMYWEKPQISSDLIDYENLLTFTLQKFIDPFISLRWESRFYDDSDTLDTFYINPNIITLSTGVKKVFLASEKQNLDGRLGAAYKNFSDQKSSVDNSSNAGAELVMSYWYLFGEKLGKFDSQLRLYQALYYSEDTEDDKWKSTDIEFVNNLSFKLSSYIGLKFYLEMLYDEEIDDDLRWKQNLGLNLSYSIF